MSEQTNQPGIANELDKEESEGGSEKLQQFVVFKGERNCIRWLKRLFKSNFTEIVRR